MAYKREKLKIGNIANGNHFSINEKGQPRLYGEASQWNDLRVSVNSTTVNGSNPPTDALFKNDGNEIPGTSYALSFLSTSQGNLDIPDDVVFDTSADFTFGFWLRPVVGSQNNIEIVRKRDVFELEFKGNEQLNLDVKGGEDANSSVQYNRGNWNHIMIIHDATAVETYLYLNNILAIVIGDSTNDSDNEFEFNRSETLFDLDYIEYWDKALDSTERLARYNGAAGAQLIGNEVGLKGLWELNDGTGTTVTEKTGITSDGTISGGSEGSEWDWIGGHVGNTSAGSRGVILKYFSPDVLNELYFEVQMPHSWMQGTDIESHVHFVHNADGGLDENVMWKMEYTWTNVGEVFPDTSLASGYEKHIDENAIKNKHYITDLDMIDATGKTLSSMLCCRVYRDVDDVNDTYPNFAGLLEIDFHYQVDSLGSNEEYVKY